jgi:hypothetical protein
MRGIGRVTAAAERVEAHAARDLRAQPPLENRHVPRRHVGGSNPLDPAIRAGLLQAGKSQGLEEISYSGRTAQG